MWNILRFTDTKFIQMFDVVKYFVAMSALFLINIFVCSYVGRVKKWLIFLTFLRIEPVIRFVLERKEERKKCNLCVKTVYVRLSLW